MCGLSLGAYLLRHRRMNVATLPLWQYRNVDAGDDSYSVLRFADTGERFMVVAAVGVVEKAYIIQWCSLDRLRTVELPRSMLFSAHPSLDAAVKFVANFYEVILEEIK